MFGNKENSTIESERLILRAFSPDDWEAVQSWAGNPENVRYMSFGPNTEEQTKEFLSQARPGKDFAVVLKNESKVIGSGGISPDRNNDSGEIGWILHKDYWKRGYGTEFCGALLKYGFETLKLRRIHAPCAAVNYGSYRVMERNGMRREALHVKAFWARIDKEWINEAVYAILAEEYFASKCVSTSINATDIDFREIFEPSAKSGICNAILRALPDWFGIESSIVDYVEQVQSMPFYVAYDGDKPVGFVAVKVHNVYAAEVCVMGVLSEYHRRGIGEKLVGCCEKYCREHNIEFLTVKTLDESREDEGYSRTRKFYLKVGFRPLEVFPLLWDADNPCLFMVKHIEIQTH